MPCVFSWVPVADFDTGPARWFLQSLEYLAVKNRRGSYPAPCNAYGFPALQL